MQKEKIQISLAISSDVPVVRRFLVERAQWLNDSGINQWQQFATYEQTQQIEGDCQNGVLYVAKLNHECVGAIVITPPKTFDYQLWEEPEGYLYIHRYVVSMKAKGLGVGMQLLDFAKAKAQKECQGLRLDCRANNQALVQYYRKQGLRDCGVKNGYARFQFFMKLKNTSFE